ncbi:hypothetical protein CONLIGDRAFT_643724 [Coniochaeta ligniaria NRRL 30616]|uniref:MARVEL domain-containing protein n=1 Tax=Coniochaeta ligniaria NRRL 30616 TaxID=1408157 RepID=A0A1J7IPU7_9PEZI|nr:hypothetical protein CONLIGDRAFT_643724 [Coniochaeta ligniaria NRRL 30616]
MGKAGYHDLDRGTPLVSRGWHIAKIVLRVFSILLSCGAIGLEVPTALKYKEEANRLQLDYDSVVDIAITVGPPLLMTLWDTIEFITLCVRRGGRRGLHPGFHVALELVFWLAAAVLTALIARIAFVAGDNADYIRGVLDSGDDSSSSDSIIGYADLQIFEGFALKTKIAAALFALLAVTRFVLFVRACVETDHRRKARRQRRNPIIVTSHHEGEASVPLTAYDPVGPLAAPPQYYDYAKPVVQVNVSEHPVYHQQSRY